ncbi:MAG: DUF4433 domain-containing protein, partial [Planctomycetes bacterium]|nr:DUF4433 domain-containing protein [Planctomycetota bacterium]
NPMMFKRKNQKDDICVLQINKEILNNSEVVLSDRNAAADYASFYKSPQGLHRIDFDLVFAKYWTDLNPFEYWRKKSIKCAEVLVPHRVKSCYIIGAYVANETAKVNLENTGFDESITINEDMFFA